MWVWNRVAHQAAVHLYVPFPPCCGQCSPSTCQPHGHAWSNPSPVLFCKIQHTKPARVKVATQTSYLLCPPLLQVLPTSGWHSSWHIFEHVSDILTQTFSLNFFQTYQYLLTFLTYFWPFFLAHSFWTSCKHIFWHSIWLILWHLATTSLTHSFCNYYQSFPSQLRPGTPHWTRMIAVGVRHAALNSQDRSWGPAHNTELTRSQLGSGTPHWTRRIAVGVRHATLNSQDRGWGPARHTELTGSRQEEDEEGGRGGVREEEEEEEEEKRLT